MTDIQARPDDNGTEETLFYHEAALNATWTGTRLNDLAFRRFVGVRGSGVRFGG